MFAAVRLVYSGQMLITDPPIGGDNQPTIEMVTALLETWSIDEVRQLIEEIEAEIARRKIH
jgi:hypothetical protein